MDLRIADIHQNLCSIGYLNPPIFGQMGPLFEKKIETIDFYNDRVKQIKIILTIQGDCASFFDDVYEPYRMPRSLQNKIFEEHLKALKDCVFINKIIYLFTSVPEWTREV